MNEDQNHHHLSSRMSLVYPGRVTLRPSPYLSPSGRSGLHLPPLGLYLHIPFCAAICNYCNFNRSLLDSALKTRYVDALIAEITRAGQADGVGQAGGAGREGRSVAEADGLREAADTIYFGGGTPSLLEPEEVRRLIGGCLNAFDVSANAEVTLEANPETVSEDRLAAYREAGVNRISFGVQSFRDDELTRLSRLHGAERARAAYHEARRAGFDNISLDLMMWLPAQQLDEWLYSIDVAIELGPEHLSLYLLELYPNAPLKDEMARAQWSQAPDEDAEAMYLAAMDRLEAAGYRQYEISNAARPGRESVHNLKYWSDGEWLAFGCGAHSTRDGVRWKNVSATDEYVDRVARGEPHATEIQRLSPDQRLGDALFTGLRLTAGVHLGDIGRRYGVDVWERFGAELEPFIQNGCLRQDGVRLWLTRRGMLLANEVMAVFV
ncbi:MAG: radical SAM family heme chaperone HemW [Acidobacteriota bacterium]